MGEMLRTQAGLWVAGLEGEADGPPCFRVGGARGRKEDPAQRSTFMIGGFPIMEGITDAFAGVRE